MLKRLSFKIFFIILLLLSANLFADVSQIEENTLNQDKTKIVTQQIGLLKNRLSQMKSELVDLQHDKNKPLTSDQVNKQSLKKTELDISIAQSNLDAINIELADSQQTINRLEKDIQEIENQLNVYNIFGLKIARNAAQSIDSLNHEFNYQTIILQLEKKRAAYLEQLQDVSENTLQFYKTKYGHIESLLKSQTVMQLKEQQARSEIDFQKQQEYWLQQLNILYGQLNQVDHAKQLDKSAYNKIENEIFYANENVNLIYLQMLISRYHDQIQQLKVSIAHSSSIIFLNKATEQTQLLAKQLDRVNVLIKNRIEIFDKRIKTFSQSKENPQEDLTGWIFVEGKYKTELKAIENLNHELIGFRTILEQSLKQELSARQGLPGFSSNAWLDLSSELLMVPSLTYQILKSLSHNLFKTFQTINSVWWLVFFTCEILWISGFYLLKYFLIRIVNGVPDHELGHVNLKWLLFKLTHRNLIEIALIGNAVWFFYLCGIPSQNFQILINLALVWLFFKIGIVTARLCLIETVQNHEGHDVRLYYRLKWTFIVGGIITFFSVFIHQLPLIYEIKDLCDRLFLAFLFVACCFLLKSWRVLPEIILLYVDKKHTYIKNAVRLFCLLVPFILLINSAIGLFGYVNLVQSISWYESLFLLMLLAYLLVRGFLNSGMTIVSQLFIRHVSNGWLWTEAILKPIDKIMRIVLFLSAWVILFEIYGWDGQSPVVRAMTKLLNYPIVATSNTSITPFSLLELGVIVSIFYWSSRWTREFVYRFLLSRTKDLGIRNSLAILSQYTVVLIGLFSCLRVLGIDFKALTVVAGFFAIGVGLGLRDLVNNFACGFLLLIERPLRVGDTVTVNDHEGEVMHIGSRAVTIRTWDHMEVIVPNVDIFSKTFVNWTAKDTIVRTVISIKINRHDKPQDVQNIIYRALASHKKVLTEPIPEVFLKELNDGLIEFEVRYFVNLRQVKSRIEVRSEVLIIIWEMFEQHGIQPPYPHHEIYLKSGITALPLLESIEDRAK